MHFCLWWRGRIKSVMSCDSWRIGNWSQTGLISLLFCHFPSSSIVIFAFYSQSFGMLNRNLCRTRQAYKEINKINKNRMHKLWQIIHEFLQIHIDSSPFSVVVFLLQPVWYHGASMTFDVRSDIIQVCFIVVWNIYSLFLCSVNWEVCKIHGV